MAGKDILYKVAGYLIAIGVILGLIVVSNVLRCLFSKLYHLMSFCFLHSYMFEVCWFICSYPQACREYRRAWEPAFNMNYLGLAFDIQMAVGALSHSSISWDPGKISNPIHNLAI